MILYKICQFSCTLSIKYYNRKQSIYAGHFFVNQLFTNNANYCDYAILIRFGPVLTSKILKENITYNSTSRKRLAINQL